MRVETRSRVARLAVERGNAGTEQSGRHRLRCALETVRSVAAHRAWSGTRGILRDLTNEMRKRRRVRRDVFPDHRDAAIFEQLGLERASRAVVVHGERRL